MSQQACGQLTHWSYSWRYMVRGRSKQQNISSRPGSVRFGLLLIVPRYESWGTILYSLSLLSAPGSCDDVAFELGHSASGKYSDALEYQLRALAIADEASGKVGRDSAGISANVGFTYSNQGLVAEAIPYFEQAVAAYKFTYGKDHGMTREYQGVLDEMRQRQRLLQT